MAFGAKIKSLFHKEYLNFNSAALFLALSSVFSMLLSLLRERLIVSQLGASLQLDIYYAAFRLPDLIFTFFIAFVSVFVIIPFLDRQHNEQSRLEFMDSLLRSFFLSVSLVILVAYIISPTYLSYFFPKLFASEMSGELLFLTRLLLLQMFFLSASQIYLSFLQYKHKFIAYALAPILYNLSIILGAAFFLDDFGLSALALSVLSGAFLHLALSAISAKISLSFKKKIKWRLVFSMLKDSLPRALSLFLQQVVLLALFAYLGRLKEGSISIFQIAILLQSAPFSVVALSYSVASFPTLSRLYHSSDKKQFKDKVTQVFLNVFVFSVFLILPLFLVKEDLINLIFASDKFSWGDVVLVSLVFSFLLFALLPQAFSTLASRVFYAADNTRLPLYVHFASSIGFIFLLSLLWKGVFDNLTFFSNDLIVLALFYSINTFVTAFIFLYFMRIRLGIDCKVFSVWRFKIMLAAFLAFLPLYIYKLNYFSVPLSQLESFQRILLNSIVFLLLFFVFALLFKLEFKKLLRILKSQ